MPGKNKRAKYIRQLEEEKKKKTASTDTPSQTVSHMQIEQERLQTPFIVLSAKKDHTANVPVLPPTPQEKEPIAPKEKPQPVEEQVKKEPATTGGLKEGQFQEFKLPKGIPKKKKT